MGKGGNVLPLRKAFAEKGGRKGRGRPMGILLAALALIFALGLTAGNALFNLAMTLNSDKAAVMRAPHNQIGSGRPADTETLSGREDRLWLEQAGAWDAFLTSRDGLRLHAYGLDPKEADHRWAIVCHGYTSQASAMAAFARHFHDMGFHVLLPDARGAGQSQGTYIGMGWPDRLDIVDWIDQILRWDPEAEIALYGISMGGATVMMAAGEALPENVKAVVEDCGYSSVWEEFTYQFQMLYRLPSFPIMNFTSLVTRVRAGFWLGDASAVAQVAKSVTPMLFIHGDSDTFVPSAMVHTVYEAAICPKELVIAQGAGHGGAIGALGDAYWETLWTFLRQYMTFPAAA
jgi:fermentation-respiration switch protein FrsA (DUF1100 family)